MPQEQDTATDRSGPYAGLTVLEVGQFIVVPFCAQFLADGGARVIKVEPPSGDAYRSSHPIAEMEGRQFIMKNRGKESVVLKLGDPDANAALRRLVEAADVVLVNMRADTVAKHGLTYEDVRAVNPGVIYGSVTAFGRNGPEAGLAGMDVVVQARSGLLYALGAEKHDVPYHSEVQVADYSSALLLLSGISAALYHRERTGEGQEVDISLLGGAITMQTNAFGNFHDHDDWRREFLDDVLPRAREEKWSSQELNDVRTEMRPDVRLTVCYRVFHTSDGAVALGAGSPTAQRRLWKLLDIDPDAEGENLATRLEQEMLAESTQYWLKTLREALIPVAEVKHIDEIFDDEQARAEDLVRTYHHPVAGDYDALGVPIKLSATPFDPGVPAPGFGQHTREALRDVGYSDDELDALAAGGSAIFAEEE